MSDSLWPNGLQHTRLPCPSPSSKLAQTHVYWVIDAIQPCHSLSSPSSSTFNLSQHQGLFQWVSSLIVLTIWTFVSRVISLLFNMLSRFVTAFLPRSKHLLISWLQSPSAVILESNKIKPITVSIVSPSICLFARKWWDWMPWSSFFECWVLSQLFHSPLLPLSEGSLVPLHFLPLGW